MNSNNMFNFELANEMWTFFVQKIETIGSKLDNMVQGLPSLIDDHTPVSPPAIPAEQIQPPFRGGGSLT